MAKRQSTSTQQCKDDTREQQTIGVRKYTTRITGENKKTTSCGRCVMNVKKRLKFEYEKQRNKN